jgi:tRNA1Val (adenine37-N6)-methyltransferase
MKESLDSLPIAGLEFYQAEKGYRFSLDPILLARFARVKKRAYVVDLGTGCGILPLLLSSISEARQLVGLELQESLFQRAQRNVEHNRKEQEVRMVQGDIRRIRELFPGGVADLVISNPPFRPADSGRIAPDDERAAARHELFGGLDDFVTAAAWLLRNGGSIAMIHLAERLSQILTSMQAAGLEPKRMRMVHPRVAEEARLVLIEAVKAARPGLKVEKPLFVYRSTGTGRDYSAEVLAMYR